MLQVAVQMHGTVGLITVLLGTHTTIWAVAVQGSVFVILAIVGVILQVCLKKYQSYIYRKNEDKSDIIKFAFTCGALAQWHLKNYFAKSQKRTETVEISSGIPNYSESGVQPISSESIILEHK